MTDADTNANANADAEMPMPRFANGRDGVYFLITQGFSREYYEIFKNT